MGAVSAQIWDFKTKESESRGVFHLLVVCLEGKKQKNI
jgi:hypothetical protein